MKLALLIWLPLVLSGTAQQTVDLGAYPNGRRPLYQQITTRSQYLRMDDGVRLAADILLPNDMPPGTKLPAIIRWTRDGRASRASTPTTLDVFFIEHDYARVLVDARGSGASFGVESFGQRSLDDMKQVVDWIVAQPWSNGNVGAAGDSSDGRLAELFAATGHPAVKAVASRYGDFDDLAEHLMPGGILAEWLVDARSKSIKRRDEIKNIKPVGDDRGEALLKQALRDRKANPDMARLLPKVSFRDDTIPELGISAGRLSVAADKEAIERSGIPLYLQAGWLDGASAAGVLRQFNELRNPQRVVIGPWNHVGGSSASPSSREETQSLTRLQLSSDLLEFFDHYLRDAKPPAEKQLLYYTFGEDKWKATTEWPPKGASSLRLHFSPDSSLVDSAVPAGSVAYSASPETTTGTTNRWRTRALIPVMAGAIKYPSLDAGRLAFTSAPFAETTDVTGTSSITIRVKSTTADAAFFAYLEIVPSFGLPRYVTEGQLRAIHRKGNGKELLKKDAEPLVPGEWADITFELLPHSVRMEKGDRIRVSLSGFDKDTFVRIPSNAIPNWTVDCAASFVDLAVVRQEDLSPAVRVPADDPDPLGLAAWKGRYPHGNGYLEVVPAFDHLTVFQVGQEVLELTTRVKPGDRAQVPERNRIAKEIADGLLKEDTGPLSRATRLLMRPLLGSLMDEWRSIVRQVGIVDAVEVMGTVDYLNKNWATSFLLVKGPRGFKVFSLRWIGMKVGGWGQNDGPPAVRDYYPAADGSFVSPAKDNAPLTRVRKRDNIVELVR